jgi:hypothetical protein
MSATGAMTERYEESVFINCPFDLSYRPMLRALMFAVYDCGFIVRSALEEDDAGEVRYMKILRIIGECKYGIHDISRVELDRKTRLPRFNMPLELGLFLGAKGFGEMRHAVKSCLVLDSEPFRYRTFCSDIAGQEVRAHGDSDRKAIAAVRDWLSNSVSRTGVIIPSGSLIANRFERFERQLPQWCRRLGLVPAELTFRDQRVLIEQWLRANAWTPELEARVRRQTSGASGRAVRARTGEGKAATARPSTSKRAAVNAQAKTSGDSPTPHST